MTMKERLKIHAGIEAADREYRIWFRNNEILDHLTDVFPIQAKVENFGVIARIVGYAVRDKVYTGDLILEDLETGLRWTGNPDFCRVCA